MSEPAYKPEDHDDGLYVSDVEIARRLGFGEKTGYRIIHRLERGAAGMRPYPPKYPEFCRRRFWPAVLQWHLDYHRVRAGADQTIAPGMWKENFDEPPSKASEPGRARPQLARA